MEWFVFVLCVWHAWTDPSHLHLALQKKTRVRIWLYEDTKTQLEGQIIGFDEYMNMVLDDAVEIGKKRKEIGRILLKGDSITLLQEAQPQKKQEPMQE